LGSPSLAAVRQSQQRDRAATASPKEAPPTPAVAATAHTGNIGVYFTGLGTVTPLYTVTVKSRVDGQILKVLYTEGQAVHNGAPLVEIDPRPYEAQLTQYEGQLAKDQAALLPGQSPDTCQLKRRLIRSAHFNSTPQSVIRRAFARLSHGD